MKVKFACPRQGCAGTVLEEVVTQVVQSTEVTRICPEGGESIRLDYGETDFNTDGCDGIDRFCCKHCGFTLVDDEGEPITTEHGLMVWLHGRGMLEMEAGEEEPDVSD
jgi:transposase-like protein